ncbi:dipeptidylpeptidase [Coemansia sp. RSA 1933]|nr:dipeptidylpeptidase [Coemansia sp. RSA 1933]
MDDIAVSPGSTAVAYIHSRHYVDSKRQATRLFVQSFNCNNHYNDSPLVLVDHIAEDPAGQPRDPEAEERKTGVASTEFTKKLKPSQPVWLSNTVLGFVAPDVSSNGSVLYAVSKRNGRWSTPEHVVSLPIPISSVQFNTESGILAFTAEVYNEASTVEETVCIDGQDMKELVDATDHRKTDATPRITQIYTLKLMSTSDNSFKPTGQLRNIIKDSDAGGRLEALGSFVFSPTGRQVAFVAKKPGNGYAKRTTSNIYLADTDGSSTVPISSDTSGSSSSPTFNHNGTKVAFVQTASPTQEQHVRNQIKVFSIAERTITTVATEWDYFPAQMEWADDSSALLLTYNERGVRKLSKIDVATGIVTEIFSSHAVSFFKVLSGTGKLLINYSALDSPNDLYTIATDGSFLTRITNMNPKLSREVSLSELARPERPRRSASSTWKWAPVCMPPRN